MTGNRIEYIRQYIILIKFQNLKLINFIPELPVYMVHGYINDDNNKMRTKYITEYSIKPCNVHL